MRIDGLQNFRDTGDTPLAGGGTTRAGVLYRSEALSTLTASGIDQLAASDIGVIADFRTETERAMAPDVLPASRPFRVVEVPLLEGAVTGLAKAALNSADPDAAKAAIAAAVATIPSLGDLYVSMLADGAAAFAQVARLVAGQGDAGPPRAVLVHCTAGKDRTGVAVALLLDAVGAERDAVVADYSSSGANLAGPWADRMRATLTSLGLPLTPALDALVTATPPAAIEQALTWVDARGGSADYLRSGGITAAELDALGARLVG